MNRLVWILIGCVMLAGGPSAIAQTSPDSEVDRTALLAKLAKVKDYHDDRVTMSPDRDLLNGFKEWGDEGLQQLRKSMSDESRDVRHHSLLLLARLPGGNDVLLETLKDESSSMRTEILGMIGHVLRDARFIPAAGELIHSKDADVAKQAIGVTGRTHYLAVASDLVQIMKSDDRALKVAAAYALAGMGVPDGAKLICDDARENVNIPLWQGKVIDTLGRSGSPDAIEYLLEIFEKGMGMTEADDEPAGMVFSAAEHDDMLNGEAPKGAGIMLTGRAAAAIASIGHRSKMPIVQQGLKHPNEHVRSAALRALGAGDPTAGKALLEMLETAAEDQTTSILYAIANTGDRSLVKDLQKFLDGPSRDSAIIALATLGEKSMSQAAIKNSKSEDQRIQYMGAIGVAALAGDSAEARERIVELFDDPSPQIASIALSEIGKAGVNESSNRSC